jgi:hypothetical protein
VLQQPHRLMLIAVVSGIVDRHRSITEAPTFKRSRELTSHPNLRSGFEGNSAGQLH